MGDRDEVGVDQPPQPTAPPGAPSAGDPRELVFAMCHEIGNLMAAVQLEADLLGDIDSRRAIAASAVKIEDLCARVGGWLTQVRPLLGDSPRAQADVDPAAIVAAVKSQIDWRGTGGATLRVRVAPDLPSLRVDPDSTRDLVLAFVVAALESGKGCKQVELAVRAHPGELRFSISDDGMEDSALADWRDRAASGRALQCAVADGVLRRVSGAVEVSREAGTTRIELRFPAG